MHPVMSRDAYNSPQKHIEETEREIHRTFAVLMISVKLSRMDLMSSFNLLL